MTLEQFLRDQADRLHPIDEEWPDSREYVEDVNDDAHHSARPVWCESTRSMEDAWLANNTSYIWKVGVLAQWDSNKCDWAYLFIGHEREPGRHHFIGCLHWEGGENDDIGRSLPRYVALAQLLRHPVFHEDKGWGND